MKNTIVISGFPAVGKSYLFKNKKELKILDSDSSQFSWISQGIRHPNFPKNYMKHIKDKIGKVDVILVSSHKVVRDALKANNINYIIVYPSISLKNEYIQRYKERGNNEGFINMIDENWDSFISEIEEDTFPTKLRLWGGEYLKDILIKKYCPIYQEFCTVKQTNADEYEGDPCCRCNSMKKLM
ncbi:DUF2325 domain-containing protein [Clostridium botulinum C]|uniref:DUF2325 domain-containing protein n=2 Tax=Clostridium botulinum TaxID=1491 RepID=A0A9Q4XWT3_CLOBO|nr:MULTISPECIES: hypothetical protein [Clostridium]YP_398472.1 hypothetical protein CST042 [Clostridium phage c-st]MCD3196066.1 DUF2325 domain-containing protein [Clostridium botulinum C]MCD3200357.1 DUF2325 domain-containing protein [Clostridium botulinum C]MCD3206890.1 DUF2325 domain-containing protein [Clostridium botulinum C]MCD3207589.1 DUF2325 domain-containing protein [Clostridium botulinum C]MCD3226323.1 DUF2325 domain-containing protein [Clostridium botulinum C]